MTVDELLLGQGNGKWKTFVLINDSEHVHIAGS